MFPLRKLRAGVRLLASALISAAIVLPSAAHAADSLFNWDDLDILKIYHAYSASDGRTYLEEIPIPSSSKQSGGKAAYLYFDLHPKSVQIARSSSPTMMDWHYAGPTRHLMIPMQGDLVFDIGDGKTYHLKAGEALLAEDWTGKGHRSGCEAVNKKTCVVIDMVIDDNPREMPLRAPPAH